MPQSDHQPPRAPGANPGRKALPGGQGRSVTEGPKVVDAEVLHGDGEANQEDARRAEAGGPYQEERFYYRAAFGNGGNGFARLWTFGRQEDNACLAPCITFALFLVCLAQFGFLAGLGFVFFHTVGAVLGALSSVRRMAAGHVPNPWVWRLGNWAVSFLITVWLAGGFD
ncbi:hypothetical protein [Desulfovibrio legallii]|jgi:hypothetical protein|uniref:Uncharacterized protein n=1 Tax=Desulfovibrio legallii TaxID=571438 RepID=A0A1G7NC81_9BACT|nr:hypothetical protein [Desulfovibrio legallii]SDF70929.1 hypothetical protein SAMN05192586_1119 [Desulfovibrio legallii]